MSAWIASVVCLAAMAIFGVVVIGGIIWKTKHNKGDRDLQRDLSDLGDKAQEWIHRQLTKKTKGAKGHTDPDYLADVIDEARQDLGDRIDHAQERRNANRNKQNNRPR